MGVIFWGYVALVLVIAVERLAEVGWSQANVRRLLSRGGHEVGRSHYPWMVALHTAFLAACVLEPVVLDRPFIPALAAVAATVLVVATGLRVWTLTTLGRRWTTRVVVVPGEAPVVAGPYRVLRHPNYLAVALEIVAVPLIHTAWLTAAVFSALNAALLVQRIRIEERALRDHTRWGEAFGVGGS